MKRKDRAGCWDVGTVQLKDRVSKNLPGFRVVSLFGNLRVGSGERGESGGRFKTFRIYISRLVLEY